MGKLLRQIIGVHILVGGNQHLLTTAVFHQRQVAAPLVFHPHGVKILRLGAQHHHDLGAVEGSEYVRLVGGAQLVLQGDAGKEHLEALLSELVVQVVGQHTIRGAATAIVRLLVADEHIKGLLLLGNGQDALLNLVDGLGLGFVDLPLGGIGIVQGGLIVVVVKDGGKLRPVHRGHAPVSGRVLHILDAVAAQDQGPVGLGIGVVLGQNLLVDAHGLVVFVAAAEVIGPVVEVGPSVIVQLGQGLLGAAAITHGHGVAGVKFQRPTAHFAFEDCHKLSLH